MIDDLIVETKMLENMCKRLKQEQIETVSFEFLVGSCFPTALANIKEELRLQYTLGYTEGLKNNDK